MRDVRSLMTPHPYTIGKDQPIAEARRRMRDHHVRHLPVLDGARLVGLLSDRDLRLADSLAEDRSLRVADVMLPEPFTVQAGDSVTEAVAAMAQRKIGSCVVLDGTSVAGIFTTVDALHLLLRHLVIDDMRDDAAAR
jgi:acetoin utilization protein AcuB